jgi:hypothetical protein
VVAQHLAHLTAKRFAGSLDLESLVKAEPRTEQASQGPVRGPRGSGLGGVDHRRSRAPFELADELGAEAPLADARGAHQGHATRLGRLERLPVGAHELCHFQLARHERKLVDGPQGGPLDVHGAAAAPPLGADRSTYRSSTMLGVSFP